LTLEVFGHVLGANGVVVVQADVVDVAPDVTVLVEPVAEHWAAAQADDTPIVLVVSQEPDDAEVVEAVLAGAEAVLSCDSTTVAVMDVLEAVGQGGSVLKPAQVRAVAGMARAAAATPAIVLSRREGQILNSIAEGHAVKQTARSLGVAAKTVENLQGRLFRKLGVRNRAQAVARAHELGLL
jgi:DNA-binding NarL/FixJ family response regulator